MKQLHDLKDRLCEELAAFSERDLNTSNLEMIDKLAHATKNIIKIIDSCDDEASYRGRGRYAKRDSMGRYSRDYSRTDELIHDLRNMSYSLPANKQEEMDRLIMKMEQMG